MIRQAVEDEVDVMEQIAGTYKLEEGSLKDSL